METKKWHYTILGNPPVKKNSRAIGMNRATGRMFPVKSAKLRIAERDALAQLWAQKDHAPPKGQFLAAKFLFYRGDRRAVDLSNLYEFPQDCLQEAGIIGDDALIQSHDGSRKLYDKENPRTEITITIYTKNEN